MAIRHSKVSDKADGVDTTVVRPSDWNADHDGHDQALHTAQGLATSAEVDADVATHAATPHGGVTDHGALTGLGDDDHPQYETSAEAAAKITTHAGLPDSHHPQAHTHDEDDLVPDTVEVEENMGLGTTGLAQGVLYRKFVADEAISVGHIVKPDDTADGRVRKTTGTGAEQVTGVALDAAAAAGDTIRVGLLGVCQVLCTSSGTATRGVSFNPSSTAGVANNILNELNIGAGRTNVGVWLETSASGSERLVWAFVRPAIVPNIQAPATGYPVDVDSTEADGSSSLMARGDHRHRLGIGTTIGDLLKHDGTNMVRFAKGTGLQYLRTNSGATDLEWATLDAIPASVVDAKGDIIAATAADTVTRLAVGANDTVLTADSTQPAGVKWAAVAAGSADVQIFTASGTWTKPAGKTATRVYVLGSGGGGGGGRGGAAGTIRGGGGAGGGGAVAIGDFRTSDLGANETITIGAGGTSGAGGSGADGSAGGAGGTTTFGAWLTVTGGAAGAAGTSAGSGNGGAGGHNGVGVPASGAGLSGQGGFAVSGGAGNSAEHGGGAGASGRHNSSTPHLSGSSIFGGAGGGGGGGVDAANVERPGGDGGARGSYTQGGGGAGGAVNGVAGAAGGFRIGGGGGGGQDSGTGGAGGNGGLGAGAGGGGGGTTVGGAGGVGGGGLIVVVSS